MLKTIVKTIIIILIIILLVTLNGKMLPQRREITDLAIVRVVGLDIQNEEAVITAVTVDTGGAKTGSDEESSGGSSQNNSAVVTRGESFKAAEKKGQSYTDKSIDAGHVSHFFIGEETARKDFARALSYIATSEEVRLSTKIYIVKEHTAEEFIRKVLKNKYDLSEKIKNVENNNKELGIITEIELADAIKMIEGEGNKGVVPVLALEEEKIEKQDSGESGKKEESKDENINFNLAGYGIFKDNNLVDFLSINEGIGYNFIKNKINSAYFTVKNTSGENLEVGLTNSSTDLSFEFDNNKLKKIKIGVQAEGNLEEADLVHEYFTPDERDYLQEQIKSQIKQNIEQAINRAKELGFDYMNIAEEIVSKKHPYKYKDMKKDIKNIWNEAEIEVIVEAEIERDYDVFKSSEREK